MAMVITQRVIILFATQYKITNDGGINQGVSIQFYPDDNMNPYTDTDSDNVKGQKIAEDTIPYEQFQEMVSVPGVYDLLMEMKSAKNKNGQSKAMLKAKGVVYVSDYPPKVVPIDAYHGGDANNFTNIADVNQLPSNPDSTNPPITPLTQDTGENTDPPYEPGEDNKKVKNDKKAV